MLWRFSLYGFLKNQRYFEPFIILAFLQMGLSYAAIGFLIGFREIMVNLMEIPSGGVADTWGRRRSMVLSMAGYILSFSLFGTSGLIAAMMDARLWMFLPLLYVAMVFFAVGDAFRTGTHKSMIFAWLRIVGRTDERTKTYGYTRSWSKIGSAVSVVFAGVFVYLSKNYILVFFITIIPYIANLLNLAFYPKELEGEISGTLDLRSIGSHLKQVLTSSVRVSALRRLMSESMGFEGHFTASKDYLQPVLRNATIPIAATLFAGLNLSGEQSSVILIVPVFTVLFLLSAVASRKAHLIVNRLGSEELAAKRMWIFTMFTYGAMGVSMVLGSFPFIILCFVLLYVAQNIWRPVLISRFDRHSDEASGATILSVESQAKSLSAAILAPILGFAIDIVVKHEIGRSGFWPISVTGALIACVFFLTARRGEIKAK